MFQDNSFPHGGGRRRAQGPRLFDGELVGQAVRESFVMLDPRRMARNPVMFVAEVGAAVTTVVVVESLFNDRTNTLFFAVLAAILWLTVPFATFAEALAEARGKAQANAPRGTRKETQAKLTDGRLVSSTDLKVGDEVYVEAGETIPADGEVVEGVAGVNEAAITGESAPVIREAGGGRSGVTGGTTVLSDKILVRVTAATGDSFLDRMIALVEGAQRQKTPHEVALTIVLSGFTLAFLIVVATLGPIGTLFGIALSVPVLVALLVCLIPTTIGGLLPAIGIAGMDQALRANLLAKSAKAVELAGDVDTLLLDKTGTITIGNRQARRFTPTGDVDQKELAAAAAASSLGDSTPEGKSIVDADTSFPYASVIPDLLVTSAAEDRRATHLPVDAKYKLYDDRSAANADVYQALLYAQACGDPLAPPPAAAWLIYPTAREVDLPDVRRLHVRPAGGLGRPLAELSLIGLPLARLLGARGGPPASAAARYLAAAASVEKGEATPHQWPSRR